MHDGVDLVDVAVEAFLSYHLRRNHLRLQQHQRSLHVQSHTQFDHVMFKVIFWPFWKEFRAALRALRMRCCCRVCWLTTGCVRWPRDPRWSNLECMCTLKFAVLWSARVLWSTLYWSPLDYKHVLPSPVVAFWCACSIFENSCRSELRMMRSKYLKNKWKLNTTHEDSSNIQQVLWIIHFLKNLIDRQMLTALVFKQSSQHPGTRLT